MNIRNIFAYSLSGLVMIIAILALLSIWGLVEWQNIQHFVGKTIQSMIVIVIAALVIYLVQSLLVQKEQKSTSNNTTH